MDVYRTPAAALDNLVARRLQPSAEFVAAARRALGALGAFLRERGGRAAAQPWRVLKTAKGGSSGRGTALRGGCDSELVLFLNCFKSYEDQGVRRAEILNEMRVLLESWWQKPIPGLSFEFPEQDAARVLRFRLASTDLENWMDVSLVPAFDALGQLSSDVKPKPQIYSSLLDSGCQGGEHAACFAELRRNFVNVRPAKLKNLILLVKHWFRQVCQGEVRREELPPAYALELLTIFAWEQGCGKETFSLAQGLRTVLGLIGQYQHLCVFWTLNYGFEDPAVRWFLRYQLKRPRPVILDPADPTWDVGNGAAWHWDLLAREAESCYEHPCFLQAAGGAVQPWEGPGLPRPGCSGLDHPIQRDSAQRTPQESSSLDAVDPSAGSRQPSRPAPGPSGTASTIPCTLGTALDLSRISTKDLDRFIQDHLKPNPQFQKQVSKAIDVILRCLCEKRFYRASTVSKGGSFGRGTDLRGYGDAELVIFLNCFEDYGDQRARRLEILDEMRAQLESWWQDPVPGLSLRFPEQTVREALQFQLVSRAPGSWMDVSLLPVFDAAGQLCAGARPEPQIYSSLLDSGCQGGEHVACFAELRRSFVNTRPPKLKNLILLVKHWYYQVAARNRGQQPACASLPPVYALELLTIFAWEQGCGNESFNTAEGLKTVLGLVQQHQQLCVYWTVNYSFEDPAIRTYLLGQLQKPRPLLLDPADPTWNVGQGSWELLAQEAAALETQACFRNRQGTSVQPWDVMPALLYQTPAGDLDKFISEFLQPSRQFLAQVNKAVNAICSFLRENCFRNSPIKVLKVVKGGSLAKGTALRGRSDADIVVFLSCFSQFTEQGNKRAEIISEIRAQLEACQQEMQFEVKFEIPKWENPRVLSFSLMSQTMLDQSVDFDVLPAFNALGQLSSGRRPTSQVYVDLIHSYNNAGEYSTCFTELQRDFIVSRPTKLKSLIRLVKHWYRQCNKMPKGKGSLPPQHGLELLTVHAWEQGGRDPQFNMAQGFRTVLELVSRYRELCVYWTVNYDNRDKTVRDFLSQQLQKPRPIILDPADPTGNLGHNARWDLLAEEAVACMSALCCVGRDGTPIQPWPAKPAPLYATPGHLLDKFIKDFLQPNRNFLDQIATAVDIICRFLQKNCFPHSATRVQKTVKGGSTGKGTALKTGSDADLVVFPDSLKSYTSQKSERCRIIKEIRKQLEACQQEKKLEVKFEISKWKAPRVLSFSLKSRVLNERVDFDVLPAFNALGQLNSGSIPSPKVYAELIDLYKSSDAEGGEFSTCFTELQCNFVAFRPTKLKGLIRLVKHWYKQCERKLKQKGSLPPKYALELLTIYAWEHGSGAENFDTAEGFRTVLELVTKYQQLCVFWTVNYNFEDETVRNFLLTQIQRTRPVILDPADPTGDVGGGDRWCWHLLAKEATEWLSSFCFKDGTGYPVRSWKVPTVQTPGSCGCSHSEVLGSWNANARRNF
ncbi:2'-5'-oligoadenylate synthase 3 isoform X3 [Panthera tigris]|uniref:2'-5'-oligoadenylate synthase 3 isoform X3 n=1 Tax=Panthera tigris TaxID=9694 RepID=UPI001C6F7F7D|nr:2'-5'-oligoadenylate synthase 3 isoform X3 [Panthera tigris]